MHIAQKKEQKKKVYLLTFRTYDNLAVGNQNNCQEYVSSKKWPFYLNSIKVFTQISFTMHWIRLPLLQSKNWDCSEFHFSVQSVAWFTLN